MARKIRMTIDMSPEFHNRFKELQASVQAPTAALVVREALQLYEFVINRLSKGYSFRTVNRNGVEENVVFLGTLSENSHAG